MSDCDVLFAPIKFLGASVLSFNASLGLGSSESSLNVDLVEDCENNDQFMPINGLIGVGAPAYFSAGTFQFGGVLTNWTATQGASGQTFNVKLVDPRQLLENTAVVTDSYLGPPVQGLNYFNAYAYWESQVLQGNCVVFGSSLGGERGMPYQKIIEALQGMNPTIYSPTGYAYTINFSSFPSGLPEYYRVAGPSVTLLQLLQDVCDVMGFDFYVNLLPGAIINIGLINLKTPVTSFSSIVAAYNSIATDLSYGQELRNEVTKTVLFGEYQHYLSQVNKFNYFFGEDLIDGEYVPVVPYRYDECGFWIRKRVEALNLTLRKPLPTNGPYTIHELDIRAAMASQDLWRERVMSESINGSFNKAVRDNWPEAKTDSRANVNSIGQASQALGATQDAQGKPLFVDALNQARPQNQEANKPEFLEDLDKVWNFIKSLGDTYYGKQFITPLNQIICYYQLPDAPLSEKVFSDIPTNAGGWIEDGNPVLQLNEPELSFFREDDGRISCFALFNKDGNAPDEESTSGEAKSSFTGDVNPPTNPVV